VPRPTAHNCADTGADRSPFQASGLLTAAVFGVSLALCLFLASPPSAQLYPATPTAAAARTEPPATPPTATSTPHQRSDIAATSAGVASEAIAQATRAYRGTAVAAARQVQAEATVAAIVTQAATTVARYTVEAQARQAGAAPAEPIVLAQATAATPAEPAAAPQPEAAAQAEPTPTTLPPAVPIATHPQVPRLVLASYLAWYDADGWQDCSISGGDQPLEPYSSDDPAAIARQVQQAMGAGIDGFLLHWYAPGERTDANLSQLLAQSQGTGFQSSVVFLRHLWPGSPAASQDTVAEALSYLIGTYGGHPNFLRLDGKPVIFFADMPRVPSGGAGAVAAWQAIRDRVDPDRQSWWIAEGLDPSYLSVFDGLYVYKVTHATDPACYNKAGQWAEWVHTAEQTYGSPKLWVATISPGYDDTRATCHQDTRVPSTAQRRERDSGSFYRTTYDAAVSSNPDWLLIQSFNEWVEGTYVEPSSQYGDLYLQLTRQFAEAFR